VGSAQVLVVRDDSTRFWTRAGGFGADEPITMDVMAQVRDFYREQGVAFGAVLVAPSLLPDDWAEIAAKLDLTEGGSYVKLACDPDVVLAGRPDTRTLDTGLRVEPIDAKHAHTWSSIMMRTFGFRDKGMVDLGTSSIGKPDWYHFAVWDGNEIIAVASTRLHRDCAHMFGAATVATSRGRGAQTALLNARARLARDAGCRWLVAETGAEAPGQHNTSLHNLMRAGFEPIYHRANWTWHRPDDSG
jgi:GNAT superfamily N-acetyltransferase